jgi:hypothetical protein
MDENDFIKEKESKRIKIGWGYNARWEDGPNNPKLDLNVLNSDQ